MVHVSMHFLYVFVLFDLLHRHPILQSTPLLVGMSSHILSLHQSSTSPMPYEEMT